MVFEGILASVLQSTFEKFVENFDAKHLKVGIWGGDIVLTDLILKASALNDLDLPVTTVYGHLGKCVLKIPWKNLYTAPIDVKIENLYLLVVPNTSVRYDEEKEEKADYEAKLAEFKRIEEKKKAELEKDKVLKDKGFMEKLITQAINNIQVKVSDIHVRYEDRTTASNPFAFGVTLKSLDVHTANENWVRTLYAESLAKVFKVTQMDSLAIYMNCNTELFEPDAQNSYKKIFEQTIASREFTPRGYHYIIGPITSGAKLQINKNPELDTVPFSIPKLKLNLKMETLSVCITNNQYRDLMELIEAMGRMVRALPYRKYRPYSITYRGHYREWWQFAITCILETEVRRRNREWSWEHIKKFRDLRREYARVYTLKLQPKKSSSDILLKCESIEKKLDLHNLLVIRRHVEVQLESVLKKEISSDTNKGWFSGWWGSSKESVTDKDNIKDKVGQAMTNEEKAKLFDAIGYDESPESNDFPDYFVGTFLEFELTSLELLAKMERPNGKGGKQTDLENILMFQIKTIQCNVGQRPAASALKIELNMQELWVLGKEQNSSLPKLIRSELDTSNNLFSVMFETNPLDKKCDQRIQVSTQSILVVYDAQTIIELAKMFTTPKTATLSQLQDAAAANLMNIKERTATGLQHAIESRPRLEINIELKPSYVVVPYGGYHTENESAIVISLGSIFIKTEPRPVDALDVQTLHSSGKTPDEILAEMISQSYDKFLLEIKNMQIVVPTREESWQQVVKRGVVTDMHLLEPTTLAISAKLCVIDDDPRMPKCSIFFELPSIHISISEDRVVELLSIATSIPLPESDTVTPLAAVNSDIVQSTLSLMKFIDEKQKKLNNLNEIPSNVSIYDEDVAQFTNLELGFILNEISIVMVKGSLGTTTTTTPSEEYHTPTDELPMQTSPRRKSRSRSQSRSRSPSVKKVGFDLPTSNIQHKILQLKINHLEMNVVQKTYQLDFSLKLGSIALDQYRGIRDKVKTINIISTPKFNETEDFLFSMDFTNCKKISPEFQTKYCSVENLITIKFATFLFVLNQEGIQDLIEIASSFQYRVEMITNAKTTDRTATIHDETSAADYLLSAAKKKLPDIVEDEEAEEKPAPSKVVQQRSSQSIVDCIQVKLDVVLEDVSVKIQNAKRSIALIEVNNIRAGVIVKSSYNEINLLMQNMVVIDPNPATTHPMILSIIGDNALKCQVVIYNLDETSDYNSNNMKISVTMGCAKIVFLNWFVSSLLNFLDNFQTAQQTIKDAGAAAAEVAKQNVVEAYTQATKMLLDIRIKAPIIAIPVDSYSAEAIAIDLGNLTISNVFKNLNSTTHPDQIAVLDEMVIELKDMKLAKVELIASKEDTQDYSYGIREESNMLNPTSFALLIKRNLSSGWYKEVPDIEVEGKLFAVQLDVVSDDYNVIMNILSRNMKEGATNKKPVRTSTGGSYLSTDAADIDSVFGVDPKHSKGSQWSRVNRRTTIAKGIDMASVANKLKKKQETKVLTTSMKFSFQIDSIVLNLFTSKTESLASLALNYFSTHGSQLSDGSMSVSVLLCDIILDDKRPNREQKLTRFMKRKVGELLDEKGVALKCIPKERSAMIDVTMSMRKNETYVDVKVLSFELILSLDFLLKISSFIKPDAAAESPEAKTTIETAKFSSRASTSSTGSIFAPEKTLEAIAEVSTTTLKLYIEKPEIILVEKMDDINCYALILNSEISLNIRLIGEKQILKGDIQDLCLYCSEFNPERRHTTKHYVIHPLSMFLNGSTPENKGLHLNLISTNIKIGVSPDIIELLNNVMTTLADVDQKLKEIVDEFDYSELWEVQNYKDNDFWFIRVDESEEAREDDELAVVEYKPELCVVEIPSILLIIESGVGTHTIPMLQLETSMHAKISDWSHKMKIDSYLRLGMSYFNSTLALWEPLIEPNEKIQSNGLVHYEPWELNFIMEVDHQSDADSLEKTQRITVSSAEVLEMTVTKTCLDVLQNLGKAFSEAIGTDGIIKPEIEASYIIINDTGLNIKINLKKSGFIMHSTHLDKHGLTDYVIVEKSDSNDIISCIILPNGRAYLDPKKLGTEKLLDQNERFLYVRVDDNSKELTLPVYKADRRYFPLYRDTQQDPFSIISEVKLDKGSTVVTLHGILQVFNHFSASIEVHQIVKDQFQLIGEVYPNSTFNVPLPYIYSTEKNIHFSIKGYKVSIQGIGWKENPSDHNLLKTLQCDPVKTYEPFYINAIRQREDVFHEVTTKYTMLSARYVVHLRPSLSLRNALPIPLIISVAGCSVVRDAEDELDASSSTLQITSSQLGEDFLDYGEKCINPGNILHLPTIKLLKSYHEPKTYIVARLLQYLEKDWSCNTEIELTEEEFMVWTFHSYDSVQKMSLTLGVRCETKNNGQVMTIYSPFWMINKTGLTLSYRKSRKTEKHELAGKKLKGNDENTNVIYHPAEYEGYILFSFREKAFFGKKKAAVRVDTGDWSDKFSLDVAGSSGVVQCNANGMTYQIGVNNILTSNSLTKQIVFMPYFVLINRAPFPVTVQEFQRSYDPWLTVEMNDCKPLWPKSNVNMLIAKCGDTNELTAPFEYTLNQNSLLQLNNKIGGLNVDVQVTEGAVYISFTGYHAGDAPALIINNTESNITFSEKGDVNEKVLQPKEKILYAWKDPTGERKIVFADENTKKPIETDLRKDCIECMGSVEDDMSPTFWMSFLDGTQRVLLFTQNSCIQNACEEQNTQEIYLKIQGVGLSLLNNETNTDVMYIGIASSDVTWEEKKKGRFKQMKIQECVNIEQKYQEYNLDLLTQSNSTKKYYVLDDNKVEIDFKNGQIHKSTVRDIRRVFYPGLWLQMKTSALQKHFHAKINRIQIDNQLNDCIFPVVLAPVPLPKSIAATTELKPFIEMSVVQRIIPHSTVKQFQYLRVLIQEFHVKVDLGFINQIVQFLNTDTTEEEAKKLFGKDLAVQIEPLLDRVIIYSQQEQKNFYDNLHLSPLKIHVSFTLAGAETKALPSILSTILQGVGVTLTDVNDVVFRLAYFEREYQFFTQSQLVSQCTTHYAGQFVKQLYVLVLGLDVIGNPFGLVVGLTKGVEDFFYEPFQGAIQGPGEFAEGLVLGVRSLFGHTVGGAAGAVSKITGAMGKGIAALTFDKDYQKQRQDNLNKTPATLREGIARSGKGLVTGVMDGVTGVFTKPISGARSEGVEGFFKGIGKGAVGLVARPAAGVVDFASGSLSAVKRATELSEEVSRLRPPRFLNSDGIVRPYSRNDSEGYRILNELDKHKYANSEIFHHYEAIIKNREIMLLTDNRVIYAVKNEIFGGWQSDWSYKWNEIESFDINDVGVIINLYSNGSKSKLSKLFSSAQNTKKLIHIQQKAKRENLLELMRDLKSKYI